MEDIVKFNSVKDNIIIIRDVEVILDRDVAVLYGVETKRINEAVKNNADKFPEGYILELTDSESSSLRSKFSTLESGRGKYSKYEYKAFTEKGLYMLATVLRSPKATQTTIAIVETFAKIRELSRTVAELSNKADDYSQKSLMQKSGDIIADILGDDMEATDTETSIELNFAVLKFKHTIKAKKK
ncbi:MAG: ORF6N domain-containing protein [Rikenellaceae bacterium]